MHPTATRRHPPRSRRCRSGSPIPSPCARPPSSTRRRPTSSFGAYPGSPSRTLPTTIWYPSDGGGPYPLVVFAHGYAVTPATYSSLLPKLAAAGYVVAAPTYPLLSGQPAGPTDAVDWDQLYPDTWFVTTRVLELSAGGDATLGGMIDPNRIAVAGHSDGAVVAFGVGYQPFRLDWRVRSVVSVRRRPRVLRELPAQRPADPRRVERRRRVQPLRPRRRRGPARHCSNRSSRSRCGTRPTAAVHEPRPTHTSRWWYACTIAFLDSTLKAHPEAMFFASLFVGDELGARRARVTISSRGAPSSRRREVHDRARVLGVLEVEHEIDVIEGRVRSVGDDGRLLLLRTTLERVAHSEQSGGDDRSGGPRRNLSMGRSHCSSGRSSGWSSSPRSMSASSSTPPR